MRFRLPSTFRSSKTVRLNTYAFALFAAMGLVVTATSQMSTVDFYFFDRYFPVAIGRLELAAATLFGVFAIAWTVFQGLAHRGIHERLGQVHFWLTFVGLLISLVAVTVFSAGPQLAAAPGVGRAYVAMFALLLTLGVQLLFPVALVLSWLRRDAV
jgi:heme/copper-type cytochrome/quinol oxidase subunit 1